MRATMWMRRGAMLGVTLAITLGGCGGRPTVTRPAPAPAPPPDAAPATAPPPAPATAASADEIPPAEVTLMVTFFTKLANAIVANGGACPAMAVAIHQLIDADQALITRATTSYAGKQMPKAAQDTLNARTAEVGAAMQPCEQHPDVNAAMMRLVAP